MEKKAITAVFVLLFGFSLLGNYPARASVVNFEAKQENVADEKLGHLAAPEHVDGGVLDHTTIKEPLSRQLRDDSQSLSEDKASTEHIATESASVNSEKEGLRDLDWKSKKFTVKSRRPVSETMRNLTWLYSEIPSPINSSKILESRLERLRLTEHGRDYLKPESDSPGLGETGNVGQGKLKTLLKSRHGKFIPLPIVVDHQEIDESHPEEGDTDLEVVAKNHSESLSYGREQKPLLLYAEDGKSEDNPSLPNDMNMELTNSADRNGKRNLTNDYEDLQPVSVKGRATKPSILNSPLVPSTSGNMSSAIRGKNISGRFPPRQTYGGAESISSSFKVITALSSLVLLVAQRGPNWPYCW